MVASKCLNETPEVDWETLVFQLVDNQFIVKSVKLSVVGSLNITYIIHVNICGAIQLALCKNYLTHVLR